MTEILSQLIDRGLMVCLEVLYREGEPLFAYQVEAKSGYSDRRVKHSLKTLKSFELVSYTAHCWVITKRGLEVISAIHQIQDCLLETEQQPISSPQPAVELQNQRFPDLPIRHFDDRQNDESADRGIDENTKKVESLTTESLTFESLSLKDSRLKDSKDLTPDLKTQTPAPVVVNPIAESPNRRIGDDRHFDEDRQFADSARSQIRQSADDLQNSDLAIQAARHLPTFPPDNLLTCEPATCQPLDIDALTPQEMTAILDATQILFGERVMLPGGRYPSPRLLLALIAEAYHKREQLRKPARVVWGNLQNSRVPARAYLDDPLSFLPESFFERMKDEGGRMKGKETGQSRVVIIQQEIRQQGEGMEGMETGSGSGGLKEEQRLQDEEDGKDGQDLYLSSSFRLHPSSLDLTLTSPYTGTVKTARQCWAQFVEVVKALLRRRSGMLEGAEWGRYVFPCRLVDFTPGEVPVFTVQAENAYAAAWLEQRFKTIARRHLAGICGQEVDVVIAEG